MPKRTQRRRTLPKRPKLMATPKVVYTFNPGSLDAQFASLHAALETQNKLRDSRMDSQDELLGAIKKQTELTNGRVTVLEKDRNRSRAWFAGAAAAVSAIVTGTGWVGVWVLKYWHPTHP